MFVLFVSTSALAQPLDPFADVYTTVRGQGRIWNKGFPNFSTNTLNGSTSDSHTDMSNFGKYEGEGFANFGTLKAKATIEGQDGGYATVTSVFNEILTITKPTATGTPGTMKMAFHLEGQANATYFPSEPLAPGQQIGSVAFTAYSATDDSSSFLTNDNLRICHDIEFLAGDKVAISPFPLTVVFFEVPFIYGEPVTTQVHLRVRAEGNPVFGDKPIESSTVNFSNTAVLIAFVVDDLPNTTVTGQSGFNYAPLVTDTLPDIPEPSSLVLLVIGFGGLTQLRRRVA